MTKIIQIKITEEQEREIKALCDIIKGSQEMLTWIKNHIPDAKDGGIKRWKEDTIKNIIGMRNLAEKNLGELLVSLQLSVGKIL